MSEVRNALYQKLKIVRDACFMVQEQKPPTGRRNRIVIDIDEAVATGTAIRRRARRARGLKAAIVGTIVAVVVLAASAGCYFGWKRYKTTPSYSLALLIDGAQRNDVATVNQLLNTEKIVNELSQQTVKGVVGKAGETNRVLATPPTVSEMNERVNNYLTGRLKELGSRAYSKPFLLLALTVPSVVSTNTQGDVAKSVATVNGGQIEMTLQKNGERWKVISVKDDSLVQRLVDESVKDLPAKPEPAAEPGTKKVKPKRRRR
jgi:hypothetical protein